MGWLRIVIVYFNFFSYSIKKEIVKKSDHYWSFFRKHIQYSYLGQKNKVKCDIIVLLLSGSKLNRMV
jgi:hypothetical protein